jgi:hypothetical protein
MRRPNRISQMRADDWPTPRSDAIHTASDVAIPRPVSRAMRCGEMPEFRNPARVVIRA